MFDVDQRLARRAFLARTGAGAAALTGLPAILAACGDSDSSSSSSASATPAAADLKGTIKFSNYPGWIGKHTIPAFEKANPGVKVEVDEDAGSFLQLTAKLKAQPGLYDMALASSNEIPRAIALGVAEEFDFSKMPHVKLIDPKFLTEPVSKQGDYLVPTDYGKTGIAIRSDLVTDSIEGWNDLWRVAPKYKGKIYWYDFPTELVANALFKLGYPIDEKDPAKVAQAGEALKQIKPYIGNLGTSGIGAALVNGNAAIAMTYDYDAYAAKQKNPKIEFIVPKEGASGYLEGWVALKGNDMLPEVQAFADFTLKPKLYADFVRENSTAFTIPEAAKYLPKALAKSPILFPPKDVLDRVHFQVYLGEAQKEWDKAYTEFKAA
jgi:spermidine/putrescine-binding protein